MMAPNAVYNDSVFGKWILAGEHAVLRGCPALVFPVRGRRLNLRFEPTDRPLTARFFGEHGEEMHLLFWGVFEKGLHLLNLNRDDFTGQISIENSIPVGAGLGASAALCSAVARWFVASELIASADAQEFARQLENLFHGESSGVDIAVALRGRGLRFVRGGDISEVEIGWQPKWYLSFSGKRGVTSECVSRVKNLWATAPEAAQKIDDDMRTAVELAQRALAQTSSETGLKPLAESIELAGSCFERWGLVSSDLKRHISRLRESGAIAVKPTGSGEGGYVLSLYQQEPQTFSQLELISLS